MTCSNTSPPAPALLKRNDRYNSGLPAGASTRNRVWPDRVNYGSVDQVHRPMRRKITPPRAVSGNVTHLVQNAAPALFDRRTQRNVSGSILKPYTVLGFS